jgi:hypothetical protein
MKKAIGFLAGLGFGLILVASGFKNSLADVRTGSVIPDTLSANTGKVIKQEQGQTVVPKKKFSFKPKPFPECRSFLITEFGLYYGLDKSSDQTNLRLITREFGLMENRDERSAIGGTLFIDAEADREGSRLGFRARYRYWLSRNRSLDIAPGILITGWKSEFEFPSFTCQTGLNLNSWLAITGQVDVVRWKTSGYTPTLQNGLTVFTLQEKTVTKPEWYLGLKFGTPAGAGIGTAAVIVVALAVAITFSGPIISGSF